MKEFILFVFIINTYCTSKAQFVDTALARVHYRFSHIVDTSQRNFPHKEKMLLVVGKNASLFTSYDKIIQMVRLAESIKQQTKANGGTLQNFRMQPGLMSKVNYSDLYNFFKEKTMFSIENVRQKYIIEENLSPIEWKITNDTTSISGIPCRKALANYLGRNWTAWYAPSLPFQSGPWKLHGLPGLIISAHDERHEVQFNFDGIDKVETYKSLEGSEVMLGNTKLDFSTKIYLGIEIRLPRDAIKASRTELNKLKKALAADPNAGAGGVSPSMTSKRISQTSVNKKATSIMLNNPIELP